MEFANALEDVGSPPRVREKHTDYTNLSNGIGITPACAGKTLKVLSLKKRTKDHPRVCGKNKDGESFEAVILGSPPRVREKHTDYTNLSNGIGITPACAGKTL